MFPHFTALQWKSLHLPLLELPYPNEYCWKWYETIEVFEPVITINSLAPPFIMELISCGCKIGCQMDGCWCHKNELLGTENVDGKIVKILT